MVSIAERLKQNVFLHFLSSVRLAVPVMLLIIGAVAVGTFLESMYNAEYAKIAIYQQGWFTAILALLGVNVLASMLSRYPWREQHVGFVVTHVGILIVLAGSYVTKVWGIDGTLQVAEGDLGNRVVLSGLKLGYQIEGSSTQNSVVFEKSLSELKGSDLDGINAKIGHVLRVQQYVPFAEINQGFQPTGQNSGPVAVSFGLKSAFFDVKEWLHSNENPEMQMGPATLRLVVDQKPTAVDRKSTAKAQANSAKPKSTKTSSAKIQILDQKTGKLLKSASVKDLRNGLKIGDVKVELVNEFKRAVVADNKLMESDDPSAAINPAFELRVTQGTTAKREILYAKYPGFSLNKEGLFGLKVALDGAPEFSEAKSAPIQDASSLPAGHPPIPSEGAENSEAMSAGGNVIEFHVDRNHPTSVQVRLIKNGSLVGEKVLKEGETYQTPWMGMQIMLGTVSLGAERITDVRPVSPQGGKSNPPSALKIALPGSSDSFWLALGESKTVDVGSKRMMVFFTNESILLPFSIKLDQFTKKDYPGTQTPYSYESLVTPTFSSQQVLISMNEPLKSHGFTLYQASYSLTPGQPPISVFSVNKDPGRPIKYAGSLVLSAGIILFTLMKSRRYKKWRGGKLI